MQTKLCDKYLAGRHPRQAELPSIQCQHDSTTPFYIPILNVFDVSRTQKKKADRFQNFSDSASGGTRGTEERQDPAMELTREKKNFSLGVRLCATDLQGKLETATLPGSYIHLPIMREIIAGQVMSIG